MLKPFCILLVCAFAPTAAAQQPASSVLATAEPLSSTTVTAPRVVLITSLGEIVLELNPQRAPKTVANFLGYVRDDFYNGTVFHRVVPGFLIQGGIYDRQLEEKRTRPAIVNEAELGLSNLRGTIAAARAPEAPHSATSQFFINLVDNRRLDFVSDRNGLTYGYAVFGRVIKGMDVVDAIAALPTIPLGPFAGDVPKPLVVITAARLLEPQAAPAASAAPTPAATVE